AQQRHRLRARRRGHYFTSLRCDGRGFLPDGGSGGLSSGGGASGDDSARAGNAGGDGDGDGDDDSDGDDENDARGAGGGGGAASSSDWPASFRSAGMSSCQIAPLPSKSAIRYTAAHGTNVANGTRLNDSVAAMPSSLMSRSG